VAAEGVLAVFVRYDDMFDFVAGLGVCTKSFQR